MRRITYAFLLLAAAAMPAFAQTAQPVINLAVLTDSDVARYREIFADERAGRFARAQALYGKLSDTSLEGYVLAEHYLSHRSGRTSVSALVHWLRDYGDLPIAGRIYKLAVRRATRHVRRHHRRIAVMTASIPDPPRAQYRGGGYEDSDPPDPPLISDAARAVQEQINAAIQSDQPDEAMATLNALVAGAKAPVSDIARLSDHVAASYLAEGMAQKAYDLAASEAHADRNDAPMLDWRAGLAAFKLGKYAEAARHFAALAEVASVPNWTRGGAAFWAARAYLRSGDATRVVSLLEFAARNEPTFYGLLAERILGEDAQTGFADPVLLQADFNAIVESPPAHRAVALWQIGETQYVDPELNRAFGESRNRALDPAYAALARQVGAVNLELRASETSAARGLLLTGLFPVPQYKPNGGYTIDPSLVLAFARIETRFQPNAVSPAGARGLMQLMPATADHIGGPGAADRLSDPAYSMTLGQRYIASLLDQYNGNLVDLCAAYNAGPGKLASWIAARDGKEDDPLMFIESMRAPETRLYVKRLLTYHWMYRRRMDNVAPSLNEAAKGGWPVYHPPHQSVPPPPPPVDTDDDSDDNTAALTD